MGPASPEFATRTIFPQVLSGSGGAVFAIILLVLSLALMFYGRSIIKGLSFLVVGLAGAAFGLALGATFLGVIGAVIGGVVGFLVGGVIGLLLVHIGMGLALGYFGYLATRDLSHIFALAVAVGVILFFVGVAISSKLLELVTAVLGGVVLYNVLVFFDISPMFAAVVAFLLAVAGFYVQQSKRSPGQQPRQM